MSIVQKQPTKNGFDNSVFLEWWSYLNGNGDPTERKSGSIKALRQCKNLTQVYACEAFGNLMSRFPLSSSEDHLWEIKSDRIAMAAYVLSYVRQHDDSMSVGWQMGSSAERKTTPSVSEGRLRRFVKIREESEMMDAFRRLVELLGKRVNVTDLAKLVRWWGNDRVMKRLTFDYYDALHGMTKTEKEAKAKARTKKNSESDTNSNDE